MGEVEEGSHSMAKGNLWHCKVLTLSPRLADLPLAEEHKASVHDEELPASGDEQGMNREPLAKHVKFSKQEFSLFPPNSP